MIFKGRAYRGHDPRWSFTPLSGEGAKQTGGRFNRKGEAALYLALDPITAIIEITQGLANRLPPIKLCEYDVNCADIADLRDTDRQSALGIAREDMACGWLTHQQAGRIAPSQRLAPRLRAEGYAGALVPSFAHGASVGNCNLVLWAWNDAPTHMITVFDPNARLPKDQRSWG